MSRAQVRSPLDPQELSGLREKYERILALRRAHVRAREDPSADQGAPREELRSLAEAYPGALRELDELPLDRIEARLDELAGAERGDAPLPWMNAQATFHRLARGALAAKRWLGGRRAVTDEMRRDFVEAAATMPRGTEALAWEARLEEIAAPPRGRVMEVVIVRVASDLGLTPSEARALLRDA